MFNRAAIIKMIPLRVRENIKYFLKRLNESKLLKILRARKIKRSLENIFQQSKNLDGLDSTEIHQKIVQLHCLTSGHALDELSNRMANDSIEVVDSSKYFSQYHSSKVDIVNEVRTKGFFAIESVIPKSICQEVVEYALNTECYPRPAEGDISALKSLPTPPFKSARYDFSPDLRSIFDYQILQDLIFDPFIFDIAQKYFNGRPYLDPVELWWYFPYDKRDDAWAENYHFDMDSIKWLKFFINFEDINVANGPHCFIEGSHIAGAVPNALLAKGYSRLLDEEVLVAMKNHEERVFTVPAGSLLIEDTRGLHKGLTPDLGRRLLFSIQYSNVYLGHQVRQKIDVLNKIGNVMESRFKASPESYTGFFSKKFSV